MKFATLATVAVVLSGADAIKVEQSESQKVELSLTQRAQIEQMETSMNQLSERLEQNQQQLAQLQSWWSSAFNKVKSWF